MGSRVLPCQSPPHSNPARRKISTNPASIFPADPYGLLSGFRPIAMPQLYADSLLPVPGDEKQPPKLLIRSCSPRFRMLPMTDEKMPVGRLWHDIFVMVRQGAPRQAGRKRQTHGLEKSRLPARLPCPSAATYAWMSPSVAMISSRPCGSISGGSLSAWDATRFVAFFTWRSLVRTPCSQIPSVPL